MALRTSSLSCAGWRTKTISMIDHMRQRHGKNPLVGSVPTCGLLGLDGKFAASDTPIRLNR